MNNINSFYRKTGFAVIAGSLGFISSSAMAQEGASPMVEGIEGAEKEVEVVAAPGAVGDPAAVAIPRYYNTAYCYSSYPSQVQRFALRCYGATYLDVYVRDSSYPAGSHWRATVQANNAFESVAVTESGPGYWWGENARVYSGYNNPTYLKASVACRYVADGLNSPYRYTGYAEIAFLSDASSCSLYNHGTYYDEPDAL